MSKKRVYDEQEEADDASFNHVDKKLSKETLCARKSEYDDSVKVFRKPEWRLKLRDGEELFSSFTNKGLLNVELEVDSTCVIPNELFSYGQNIKTLTMLTWNLKRLPAEIGYLTNLTDLNLFRNPIGSIPDGLSQLVNLKTLDLSRTGVRVLKTSAFSTLVNLEKLDISKSRVHRVQSGIFPKLTNLSRFKMHNCPFKDGGLPDDLSTAPITKLDISGTLIKKMFPAAMLPRHLVKLSGVGHARIDHVVFDDLSQLPSTLKHVYFCSRNSPERGLEHHCIFPRLSFNKPFCCIFPSGVHSTIQTCILTRFSGDCNPLIDTEYIDYPLADKMFKLMEPYFPELRKFQDVEEMRMIEGLQSRDTFTGHMPTEIRQMILDLVYENPDIPGRVPAVLSWGGPD